MGDFLPKMAGKPVFKAAQVGGFGFDLMVLGQSLMCRLSANVFIKALFSSAQGEDVALIKDADFKNSIAALLKQAMIQDIVHYKAVIGAYVRDWRSVVKEIDVPVRLWHGKADNWSPVEMANALSAQDGGGFELKLFDNLSHYSTLKNALPACLKLEA